MKLKYTFEIIIDTDEFDAQSYDPSWTFMDGESEDDFLKAEQHQLDRIPESIAHDLMMLIEATITGRVEKYE